MTEKKSMWDTIKGLAVEQVPDAGAPRVTPVPAPPFGAGVPSVNGAHDSHPPIALHSAPDPKALENLEAKLQQALPDAYKSFVEQYNNLDGIIADEATRTKAALKTSKTSIEQVAAAFDQLLEVMEVAHTDFQKKYEGTKTSALGTAKQQIDATDELIRTREAQLKSIQDEIVSLRSKRSADAEQMQNEEVRLEGIRAGYEAALVQIVGRLNGQKARILSQR